MATIPIPYQLLKGQTISTSTHTYTIEKEVGVGGFGRVFKVLRNEEVFALKILDLWNHLPADQQEFSSRFDREFRTGQIESDYIVRSYDCGVFNGNPFFVMDYCPNGTLTQKIIENQLTKDAIEKIAIDILLGLRQFHSQGIMHRDLKPDNVIFDENQLPKLCDFGIAAYINNRMTRRNWRNHVNEICGTVVYMAPEQCDFRFSFQAVGNISDIYSFGVLMYETWTGGNLPFGNLIDNNVEQFVQRAKTIPFVPLRNFNQNVPKYWDDIIAKCLQPLPSLRFQKVEEILAKLQNTEPNNEFVNTAPKGIYLTVLNGDMPDYKYNLIAILRTNTPRKLLRLGWSQDTTSLVNDVPIVEKHTKYISERHATIEFISNDTIRLKDGQWYKKDSLTDWYLSLNGVLVNSIRVPAEGILLKNNDLITVGDTVLRFEANH
jgi:serine/threonine protein kinase